MRKRERHRHHHRHRRHRAPNPCRLALRPCLLAPRRCRLAPRRCRLAPRPPAKPCHPERSEGSQVAHLEILRFAQDDKEVSVHPLGVVEGRSGLLPFPRRDFFEPDFDGGLFEQDFDGGFFERTYWEMRNSRPCRLAPRPPRKPCHPERSEGSQVAHLEILRFAQDDKEVSVHPLGVVGGRSGLLPFGGLPRRGLLRAGFRRRLLRAGLTGRCRLL